MLKLSVCVITYNQEKYIGQCLQSILDQETNFEFEIIVGEDCSTDSTRAIVQDFERRYPSIIKPIYQTKNIGAGVNNFITTHRAARGSYIAHVDGDDYCLPGKLQKQVDILDSDPDCSLVFHRMKVLNTSGKIFEGPLLDIDGLVDLRFSRPDFLQHPSIGWQSSKMYRSKSRDYPIPNFEVTDVYSTIEQVGFGYARFAGSEALGVYRLQIGITKNSMRLSKALTQTLTHYNRIYPEFRLQINTAMLVYLLADLKNLRKTSFFYLIGWIKTFHWKSVFQLQSRLAFIKSLIVHKEDR
jgi:glycosyltransferase involved in cell wall biosynthesis